MVEANYYKNKNLINIFSYYNKSKMFRFISKYIKFTNKVKPPPLHRWNLKDNSDVKSIFANHDHCGDKICKDPQELIRYTRKADKNINTFKN